MNVLALWWRLQNLLHVFRMGFGRGFANCYLEGLS